MSEVIFISGIDTDAGKTYATGWLAKEMMGNGKKVATLKFIQTGCEGFSEDIELHRRIMGVELEEDKDLTTSPIIFSYPASAQLAARLDKKEIDLEVIDKAVEKLKDRYDVVLVEGAGGLMVPITDELFTIDYSVSRRLPMMLVTNSVLGSINHTVLSLEVIKNRGIILKALVYNSYFDNDEIIADDTKAYLKRYLSRNFPEAKWIEIPKLNLK